MKTNPIVFTGNEENENGILKKFKEKKPRNSNQRTKEFYYIRKACGACMDDMLEIMNEVKRY